jgi:hypothetical protein
MNLKTKQMKESKLVPMTQYILDIDWLTTKEFCDTYKIPHPVFTGDVKTSADQFLQVDAIKHKMFVEYAKFLVKPLKKGMFIPCDVITDDIIEPPKEGDSEDHIKRYHMALDRVIFKGFVVKDFEPDKQPRTIKTISHSDLMVNVYWWYLETGAWKLSIDLKTINDLTKFGLTFKDSTVVGANYKYK